MTTNTRNLALTTATFLAVTALAGLGNEPQAGLEHIQAAPDQILFEQVGQGVNFPAPGQGAQFGYFTRVKDVEDVFAGAPENETSALFTFYQELSTVRVIANGPIRMISREGTTTVYLNSGGANFSDPDSFRQGTAIQTSTVRQQVVIDTVTQGFTAVNEDVVTSTSAFLVDGKHYKLGKNGDVQRTMRTGRLNSPGLSPIGWFAGYTVGSSKAGKDVL